MSNEFEHEDYLEHSESFHQIAQLAHLGLCSRLSRWEDHDILEKERRRLDYDLDAIAVAIQRNTKHIKTRWVERIREIDPEEVIKLKETIRERDATIEANKELVNSAEKKIVEAQDRANRSLVASKIDQDAVAAQKTYIRTLESDRSRARERCGELLLRIEDLEKALLSTAKDVGARKLVL